jgi:V-type H+-transporting ATPase subunit E
MPLEAILQALDAEAEVRVAEILQESAAQIEQIETTTRQQADVVRQQHVDAVEAPLQAERARKHNQAKRQALQMVLGTREEAISAVLETAAQELVDFSRSAAYRPFLERLVQEAVAILDPDQPLCIRVKQSDLPLMQEIIQSLAVPASTEPDLRSENTIWDSGLGGLIVATADERVSLINTLEIRLQRAAEMYRSQISEWLFGSQTED